MTRKISLALLIVSPLLAAEVTFNGTLEADVASYLDQSWKPQNSANQTIYTTTRVEFDQKANVELYLASVSSFGGDSTQDSQESVIRNRDYAAQIDDPSARWSDVYFNGILFQWEFSRLASLLVGDMTYSLGQSSHYSFTNIMFATILPGTYLRGLGAHLGEEGQVYLGAPDTDRDALWGFASYRLSIMNRTDEKMAARLAGDLVFKNGGRQNRYTLGSEFEYSRSKGTLDYGVFAAAGMIPYKNENTYTLLLEPSLSWGDFSIGASMYQAFLAEKDSALSLQTTLPVQRYATIEPGVSLIPQVALGVAGEYHDVNIEIDGDEYFACTPNIYLYPVPEIAITFWSSYRWNLKATDTFAMGIAAKADF